MGTCVFRGDLALSRDGYVLLRSDNAVAPHANGRVTHVVYDLFARRVVGGTDTNPHSTGLHSKASFSANGHRIYVSEGRCIRVCNVA